MRQEFYFCFLERCLVLIEYLKIFDKIIDVYINEIYSIYNDSKIYKVKETKIENTDVLKIKKTFRSF